MTSLWGGLFHPVRSQVSCIAATRGRGHRGRLGRPRSSRCRTPRHQVQVLQIAQQADATGTGAGEKLGVQPVGLVRRLLGVAPGERLQLLGGAVADLGLPVAQGEDIGFGGVRLGDLPGGVGEVRLGRCRRPR
jgi:hypothetical protein